jgi:hypothetical protein
MGVVDLLAPGGGRHQQRGGRLEAEQVVEEPQGLPVGPVQVVGDQQQRPARGQQRPGQGVEQPPAPVAVGQRVRARDVGRLGAQLGQQPAELTHQGRVQPGQLPGQRLLAQPGHHRSVGQGALRGIRAGRRGHRPTVQAPGAELLHQPGLADAGLAGDQHQAGRPALGGPPQLGQPGPLASPADQRRAAERAGRSALAAGGEAPAVQQGLVDPPGRRRWLHAQLALQDGRAGVVGSQRPGPVAAGVVQAHQDPVGLLVQRVGAHQLLGSGDRLGVVAAPGQQPGQPLQGLQPAPAELVAFGQEPLVLAAFQQVAPVELDRLAEGGDAAVGRAVGPGQGGLEGVDVQPGRPVRPPLQRPRGHLEEPVEVGQGLAEVVQHVAQVGPGLRLAGVGPEQEGQALPGLGRLPVQQQVGEQRLRPRRLERRQRESVQAQVQLAEEPDAECRRRRHA